MSRAQRLSFLAIAVVVGVVAVVVILASGGGSDDSSSSAASGKTVVLEPGKVQKLKYTQGDEVRFQVRSPKADEVHVHGYNIERELTPNQTTTIAFKATINGIFDIEVHSTDTQIGQLTVEPK
jgi:pullulanase/glycogen debranching enzyme